jgi:hypothetical protein
MVGSSRPSRRPARGGARSRPGSEEPDPPHSRGPAIDMSGYGRDCPIIRVRDRRWRSQTVPYDTRQARLCTCGHSYTAHRHYRRGTECSLCPDCPRWRRSPGVIIRAVKRLSSAFFTGPNLLLMRNSWSMMLRSSLVQVALWLRARSERERWRVTHR